MNAALRPGVGSSARPKAVDEWVTVGFLNDMRQMIAMYERQGATVYGIQIPADDFGHLISEAQKNEFVPFTPTLLGVPCMPWEKDHAGVMARKRDHDGPLLVDHRGRELTTEGD